MTWYLRIEAPAEPSDKIGLDENRRPQWSFNITAVKRPSVTFTQEIVALLVAGSVGVFGQTIFAGALSVVPVKGDGPYLKIRETGGLFGLRTQNQAGVSYARPSAQIVVVAGGDPSTASERAKSMAYAAYNILTAVLNDDVNP